MPLVEVTLVEGRPPEQLRRLLTGLTNAVHEAIDAPVASIRVVIREVPATHWAVGDVTIAERDAASPAGDVNRPTHSSSAPSLTEIDPS